MFEYLMPSLWMRSYPETLISRTLVACVQVQRAFTRSLNIPWGISESGSANQDDAGHYQYKAYGVPELALFSDADAGPVIAPYATFLALGVDSVEALRNLRTMAAAGWVGAYGFLRVSRLHGLTAQRHHRARMDGASPGHGAACDSELPARQRSAGLVPCQPVAAGHRAAAARDAHQRCGDQAAAARACHRPAKLWPRWVTGEDFTGFDKIAD